MLDDLIYYKEQRLSVSIRERAPQKVFILVSSLELGSNRDKMFSRFLMNQMLESLAEMPGVIYTALTSEATLMASRNSSYLKALLKLSERGELMVHSDSWRHYYPEDEPFVGKLRDMDYIVARMATADKVISLR